MLRVLEKLGIECDVPEVLAKISGVKGLTIRGKRIHTDLTVERFRQDTWMPELFEHSTLGKWQYGGYKSLRDRAREIARATINASTFELDAGMQKELDRIYRKAAEVLG